MSDRPNGDFLILDAYINTMIESGRKLEKLTVNKKTYKKIAKTSGKTPVYRGYRVECCG